MQNLIEMALKSLVLPKNCKNHPAAGDSVRSVTCLSCIGFFSAGPKLDNFFAKNFWFKPPLSKQNCGCALGRIHACKQIFQGIIRATYETS